MPKHFLVYLAAATGMAAAQPALASPASDGVAVYAGQMQELVGSKYEGGLTITQIRPDGEVLVVVIDGPLDWRNGIEPKVIGDAFAGGFCQQGAAYFDAGMKLRVDTTEEGGKKPAAGSEISSCPAK